MLALRARDVPHTVPVQALRGRNDAQRWLPRGARELASASIAATIAFVGGAYCHAQCETTPIPLVNASFETPVLPDGAANGHAPNDDVNAVPGWVIDVSGLNAFGVFNPLASHLAAPVPDGQQVAWSNVGLMTQTVADNRGIIEPGYTYTLQVDVGDRVDSPFPVATITLSGQSTTIVPPNGGFVTATIELTPTENDSRLGQRLLITLRSSGVQALFDNVRLSRRSRTSGGCYNQLVCDSIRWPGGGNCGGSGDYLCEPGARTFLPFGENAQIRRTFRDHSGRTYVGGDGAPFDNVGPTYVVIRYANDGLLDETFPSVQSPFYLSFSDPQSTRRLWDVAVGPDDELFILGTKDANRVEIVQYTPATQFVTTIMNARPGSIVVNGEYYLYLSYFDFSTGDHVTRREKINLPNQLTPGGWERRDSGANSNAGSFVRVDPDGSVYSVFVAGTGQGRVTKRDIVGETIWTANLPVSHPNGSIHAVGVSNTHLFVAGQAATYPTIWRLDLKTGSVVARDYPAFSSSGPFVDLDVRPDGSAAGLARTTRLFTSLPMWVAAKLKPTFESEFAQEFARDGSSSSGQIALDNLGNVYAATPVSGDVEIRKLSTATAGWPGDQALICPNGGCLSWQGITGTPTGVWLDAEFAGAPVDLLVTGAGDVITSGPASGNRWRTVRLGQAWQSAPFRVINTSLRFLALDQSIWDEGDDPQIDETVGIIPPSYPAGTITWDDFGASIGESIDVPLLGDFGAEVGFDVGRFDGPADSEANLRLRAAVSGGAVDVDYPMLIQAEVPGDPSYLIPGRSFQFVAGCNVDPTAGFRVSPIEADVTINARLKTTLDIDLSLEAFSVGIDEEDFPILSDVLPIVLDEDLELFSLAELVGPTSLELGIIEVSARLPEIAPHVVVDPATLSTCADRVLTGVERDRFLTISADSLTNYITQNFLGVVTALDLPLGYDGIGLFLELAVLQFRAEFNVFLEQEFSFTAREPFIELLDPATGQRLITPDYPAGIPPFHPSDPPQLIMPAGGSLAFQPLVYLPSVHPTTQQPLDNFRNATRLILQPKAGFDTVRAGIEVDFGPVGFGDDVCLGCPDFAETEITIPVYTRSFRLDTTQTNSMGQVVRSPFEPLLLPPIKLIGSTTSAPELSAISRESATVYLYNQIDVDGPNYLDVQRVRAEFAAFAGGSTPVLLYGRRFRAPSENAVRAVFWIHGAERSLPTTWLDDGQLLVQFPNWLRLLPGIGRFWVETDGHDCNGNPIPDSNTIDFRIDMPHPNLYAVAPNLWAADPDFADIPLVMTDRLNPRGGDSYVARRDYYVQLRSLWQHWSTRPAGLAANMRAVFPEFDLTAIPQRPTIVWTEVDQNDVPIQGLAIHPFGDAFAEPVDSGLLVSQMPRAYFSMPKKVQIRLLSPGPGGGLSNAIPLYISAPPPVVNAVADPNAPGLRPAEAAPGSGSLRLLVRGPRNVPDPLAIGFQGNFNAASVVRWDGQPAPTLFLESSKLQAQISAAQLTPGPHVVTVFTPDRASIYFNPTLGGCDPNDPNSDPNAPACFQLSGGESNAVIFHVRYALPVIERVSPTCFEQHQLDLMPAVAPDSGFSSDLIVTGGGFAPASVAHWNGQPRVTTYVSPTQLRVRLNPADTRVPGAFAVTVTNPAPGGGVSNALSACVSAVVRNPLIVDADVNNGAAHTHTIQAAIDIAVALNATVSQGGQPIVREIIVKPGIYLERLDLRGARVHLHGESSAGSVFSTIVDAGAAGNALRAVSGEGADTIVEGLTFANASASDGGAVHVHQSSPTLRRCVLRDSTAQTQGGGVDLVFSDSRLENCLIVGNVSNNQGGGVYVFAGSPTLVNCTIVNNSAAGSGGGAAHAGSGLTALRNSIVWGNTAPVQASLGGNVVASWSLVQGGFAGNGNLSADPRFINAASDFRLGDRSPAIDAGNNALVTPGVLVDLAGAPRFYNDAGAADVGAGSPPLVDMGCMERQTNSPPAPCPGDVDGDHDVDLTDLATLLTNFGSPAGPAGGDVDGDGVVTLSDLATLLSVFGSACP